MLTNFAIYISLTFSIASANNNAFSFDLRTTRARPIVAKRSSCVNAELCLYSLISSILSLFNKTLMRNKQYNKAIQSLHLIMCEQKFTRAKQEQLSEIFATSLARTKSLLCNIVEQFLSNRCNSSSI